MEARKRERDDEKDIHGLFAMNKKKKSNTDSEAILQYIDEHGFGETTPPLTKSLKADVFKQHYYDKNELMEFCRSVGISTSGLKNDLNDRIEVYLRTGKITVVPVVKKSSTPDSETGLSLTKVVVNYKSDPVTRRFFERNLPSFTGFSALVQKQIKQRLADGEEFTYADVIEMHKAYLRDKSKASTSGEATKVAHDSCQFNQFYIDYSHDSQPKIHTAKDAWMLVRGSAGAKTYQRYQERIAEIRNLLTVKDSTATL